MRADHVEMEVDDRTCCLTYRLVGLVVKASAPRAEDPRFESYLRRDFSGRVIPVT